MTVETTCRYEDDFLLWTKEQANLLREAARRGVNFPLDWENLAEEIESLGRSERRELRNRLDTIIEHLLKLEHAQVSEPRRGWQETVFRERRAVEAVLEDNPSLRREVPEIIEKLYPSTGKFVAAMLIETGEADKNVGVLIALRRYTLEEVLGSWLPVLPNKA